MFNDILVRYIILFSSHLFTILIPVLAIPLIVSRVGELEMGHALFVQSIVSYFLVFIDYDFNVWGVRLVANGNSPIKTYSSIVGSKFVLGLISTFIFGLMGFFFLENVPIDIYLSGLALIWGYVFNPVWYFQSQEKTGMIALVNITSKASFLILLWAFVNTASDIWLFNFYAGITLVLSGFFVFFKNGINFGETRQGIKRGANLFFSNIAINIYTNSSLVWVGMLAGQSDVTKFAVVDRLVYLVRGGLVMYAQIILPKVAKRKGRLELMEIEKINALFLLILITFGVIIFFSANLVCQFFLKKWDPEVIQLIQIASFTPFIIGASVLPNQWLIAHAPYHIVRNIFIGGAISAIILFPVGYSFLGLRGISISLVAVEALITVLLFIFYRINQKVV